MTKITNRELAEDLSYIKGKIEAADEFAKEHRSWEVTEIQKIQSSLEKQNGRVRRNEVTLGWFKGITAVFSVILGWLFKRTF